MRLRMWSLWLLLAAAGGWLALRTPFDQRAADSDAAAVAAPRQSLLVAFEPPQQTGADSTATELFDEFEAGPVHADAVDVPVPLQPRPSGTVIGAMPAELPRVAEAQPINRPTAAAAEELRRLLAQELNHLDEDQRRVWQDVLQGMSPQEALEIIDIWKATGGPPPSTGSPLLPSLPVQPAEVAVWADDRATVVRKSIEANLRHLQTPGYRRIEPLAHGVQIEGVATRLDLSPGRLQETHNPLHVAIAGTGFFRLQRGNVTACTRNGEFDLSESQELIQRRSDGEWSLEPAIQLPQHASAVQIHSDGSVTATVPGIPEPVPCGRIQLACCVNPQHLQPLRDDLLQAGPRSGALVMCNPGDGTVGTLRAGAIELSNATLEAETRLLEHWEQLPRLGERLNSVPRGTSHR